MPIIRRNNCIYETLDTCHSVWMTVWYAGWNETVFPSTLHSRQSSTQSDKYKVSHRYSYFSLWWAHSRPKNVEKRNKHTKNNCAPNWLYLQDCTRMHGQKNIKNKWIIRSTCLVLYLHSNAILLSIQPISSECITCSYEWNFPCFSVLNEGP